MNKEQRIAHPILLRCLTLLLALLARWSGLASVHCHVPSVTTVCAVPSA